jgi:hypothetical protein
MVLLLDGKVASFGDAVGFGARHVIQLSASAPQPCSIFILFTARILCFQSELDCSNYFRWFEFRHKVIRALFSASAVSHSLRGC